MARFFRRGVSQIRFAATIAGSGPTVTPIGTISAGDWSGATNLTGIIGDLNGFQFKNAPIDVPDLASSFVIQILGPDTVEDSSLTFYDDTTGTASPDYRTVLAKGVSGFILLAPYGATTGRRVEAWPAISTGVNDEWSLGNDPARTVVGFAVLNPPAQNKVVP